MNRYYAVGLTGGALWLIGICAAFEAWALVAIRTTVSMVALVAMLLVSAILTVIGIGNLRAMSRLWSTAPERTERDRRIGRRIGRQYALVIALEVVGFVVVNSLLVTTNRIVMIPAADLVIVGVHFFPLARLFHVRRYYPMAVLFCAIPVLVVTAFPDTLRIGHVQAWWVLPTLGCGVVGIATAAGSLREVRRFLDDPDVCFQ
jgi:hypothetical protein